MEAYRRYTPCDPQSEELRGAVSMAFIGQSATDIRRKLQRLDGLQGLSLRDLVKEAEKVYYKRETAEEKEIRLEKEREEKVKQRQKRQNRDLTRILAAAVRDGPGPRGRGGGGGGGRGGRSPLGPNQCAYCKEEGHWARECPKKLKGRGRQVLALED